LPLGTKSKLSIQIAGALPRVESQPVIARWALGSSLRPHYSADPMIRVLVGAHRDALTEDARIRLYGDRFRVSPRSDRMGYRLEGEPLRLTEPLELLSEAVVFGTIQLPPDGQPIVLMADRQTTGGYPRIGEVATVDLPLLAQLKPGDQLSFRPISLEEAQALYVAREHEIAEAKRAIALQHS
jgi:antagonist of KipI